MKHILTALLVGVFGSQHIGVRAAASEAQVPTAPLPANQARDHIGERVIVEDIPVEVTSEPQSGFTYVNFGGRFPAYTFRLVVPEAIRERADASVIYATSWLHVVGTVRLGAGGKPEILCDDLSCVTKLMPSDAQASSRLATVPVPPVSRAGAAVEPNVPTIRAVDARAHLGQRIVLDDLPAEAISDSKTGTIYIHFGTKGQRPLVRVVIPKSAQAQIDPGVYAAWRLRVRGVLTPGSNSVPEIIVPNASMDGPVITRLDLNGHEVGGPAASMLPLVTPPAATAPISVSPTSSRQCCRVCTTGKPCGNTCISRSATCHAGPGCACGVQ